MIYLRVYNVNLLLYAEIKVQIVKAHRSGERKARKLKSQNVRYIDDIIRSCHHFTTAAIR